MLIDLWGVIHDGSSLYPRVLETLYKIKNLDKEIIILSNVPRRKKTVITNLDELLLNRELYDDIAVSGELAYEFLAKNKCYGNKYFYIGSPDSEEVIPQSGKYTKVAKAIEADFSIITSTLKCHNESIKLAMESLKHQLPLLCINPDNYSITKSGKLSYCAGIIAKKYESLGGKVVYFGKPYEKIYQYALKSSGPSKRILAIGDSMDNDIKGANGVKVDSVLVCSGIHRHDLNISVGQKPTDNNLLKLFKKYSFRPTYILSTLSNIIL